MKIKAVILLLLSFILTAKLCAQDSLFLLLPEVKNSPSLKFGQWGVYAEYTDDGEKIFELNSEEALAPASGLKVFTTSLAFVKLGEDFRFETKLYYDGILTTKGILNGNIYIKGCGDPTLGSAVVNGSLGLDTLMRSWTAALKSAGIKNVNGSIIADAALFNSNPLPDTWTWGDIGNYYGASQSALCINDNLYSIFFRPGKFVGDKTDVIRTEPDMFNLEFENLMLTGPAGSGDNGIIYCTPMTSTAVLRGTIPFGVNEFFIKGSIPDPALYSALYFTKSLNNAGITVKGKPLETRSSIDYSKMTLVHITFSPQLRDIIFIVNKRSNNLYTEQLLRTVALKLRGIPSTEAGTQVLEDFLRENNIPSDGVHLYDGCGLSRHDAISAKAMSRLLSFNSKQKYFPSFLRSLWIAGDTTSIENHRTFGLNTPVARKAFIKDGYISGVRSHSGYVRTKSGRLVSFSFIANNYNGGTGAIEKIHLALMIKLAELP